LEINNLFHRVAKLYLSAELPYFKDISREEADRMAYTYFKKKADLGSSKFMHKMGLFCYEGRGVEQSCIKAESYWKQAWEAGWSDSAYALGNLYAQGGKGVEQSYEKSLELYLGGLNKDPGNWKIYFKLAEMYQNGLGVLKDEEKANRYRIEGEQKKRAKETEKETWLKESLEFKYTLALFDELRELIHGEGYEAIPMEQKPVSRKRKRE
jgi:TPR repeat protein